MAADDAVWIDVLPSLNRFIPDLRRQLTGVTAQIGKQAGADFGKGFDDGASSSLGKVSRSAKDAGDAQAKAASDSRDLARGLKDVDDSSSKASSSLGRIGSIVGGVVRGIGVAVGAAGAVGVSTAADLEQASIGFTTMLGSAEKAGAFLGDLKKFAASTPFEFPELQTAASSLISAGVNADKVIPIMTSLGNATSGMGTGAEGVQRATVALQQMNAAGKITAEDLNQLRDAGIPVYDLLAAATGKSKEEVAGLAASGKLGREELGQLMTALENGTGLERFTGLMDKQSQSLNGLWSTLKDTFKMGMADAIQPLVPLIKDGLGGAIEWTAATMPKISDGLQTVVAKAVEFGTGLKGVWDILHNGDFSGSPFGWAEDSRPVDMLFRIRDGFAGIYDLVVNGDYTGKLQSAFGWEEDSGAVDFLFNVRDGISGIYAAVTSGDLGPARDGLSSIMDSARDLGPALSNAYTVFQSVTSVLPSFSTILSAVDSTMAFLADHTTLATVAFSGIAVAFGLYKIAMALSNVVALASLPIQAGQVAANFALAGAIRASTAAATTGAVEQAVAGQVVQVSSLKTAATALATAGSVVAGWVMMGAQSLLQAARMAAAWVLAMGPVGWIIATVVALTALIIANWDTVVSWTKTAWSAVTGAIGTAWDWIKSVASVALSFLTNLFLNFTGPGLLIKHWDDIVAGATNAWHWVEDRFTSMKNGVVSIFTSIRDTVGTVWDGLLDKVKTPIKVVFDFVNGSMIAPINTLLGKFPGGLHIPDLPHLAGGGLLRGPGTGTSDSILGLSRGGVPTAMVSNGEFVVNAKATQRNMGLLQAINGGLPGFADGGLIGWAKDKAGAVKDAAGGAFDWATDIAVKGARKVAELVINPLRDTAKGLIPGGNVIGDVVRGFVDKLADSVLGKSDEQDKAQQAAVTAVGAVGAGVERWAPLVAQALSMLGQPGSLIPTVLRRMNQESGGNAAAINNWDINAARGTPSKGLMQVIDPTFRANAMPGYASNIYDPLSNILASMRYAISRYGSLATAYNRAGGYAAGTTSASRGLHLVGEEGPELLSFRGGESVLSARNTLAALTPPPVNNWMARFGDVAQSLGPTEVNGLVNYGTIQLRDEEEFYRRQEITRRQTLAELGI